MKTVVYDPERKDEAIRVAKAIAVYFDDEVKIAEREVVLADDTIVLDDIIWLVTADDKNPSNDLMSVWIDPASDDIIVNNHGDHEIIFEFDDVVESVELDATSRISVPEWVLNAIVASKVTQLMQDQAVFTAYDVTRQLRDEIAGIEIDHETVRLAVHSTMAVVASHFRYTAESRTYGEDVGICYVPVSTILSDYLKNMSAFLKARIEEAARKSKTDDSN